MDERGIAAAALGDAGRRRLPTEFGGPRPSGAPERERAEGAAPVRPERDAVSVVPLDP